MPSPDIQIARLTDMYGHCKCVKLYRNREEIADSHFSSYEQTWYVWSGDVRRQYRYDLAKLIEDNLQAVELLLKLAASLNDCLQNAEAA